MKNKLLKKLLISFMVIAMILPMTVACSQTGTDETTDAAVGETQQASETVSADDVPSESEIEALLSSKAHRNRSNEPLHHPRCRWRSWKQTIRRSCVYARPVHRKKQSTSKSLRLMLRILIPFSKCFHFRV